MKQKRKRSFAVQLLSIFFVLLGSIALFTAFLPTLVSSSWGKTKLTAWINQSIPGAVDLDTLSLTWRGPQRLQGVTLLDAQRKPVLTLEHITINASLFDLIRRTSIAGAVEWKSLNIHLIGDSEGNTNLLKALDKSCCKEPFHPVNPVVIDLKNTDGKISLADNMPMTMQLTGETQRNGSQGKFFLDAEMKGVTLQQVLEGNQTLAERLASRSDAELKVKADIANFPVDLLDQLISLRSSSPPGLLTELLGDTLNLTVNQQNIAKGISLNVIGKTPALSLNADVLVDQTLTLAKPAQATLNLTPASISHLKQWLNIKTPWELSSPAAVSLSIADLQVPLSALKSSFKNFNAESVGIHATLDINQANLVHVVSKEPLDLRHVHATVATEADAPKASVAVTGEAMHADQPAKIRLNVSIPKQILLKDTSKLSLNDMTIEGEVVKAPLAFLDSFITSPVSLATLLGPQANLAFSMQPESGRLLAAIQFKSERLEIPRIAFWLDHQITLHKSSPILLKVNPYMMGQLFPKLEAQLQGPATAQLTLNTCTIPMEHLASPWQTIQFWDLDATVKIASARFSHVPHLGAFSLNDFLVHFFSTPSNVPVLSASFHLLPEGQNLLGNILGKKAQIKTSVEFEAGTKGQPVAKAIKIDFNSDAAIKQLGTRWFFDPQLSLISVNFAGSTLPKQDRAAQIDPQEPAPQTDSDFRQLRGEHMAGKFRGSASLHNWKQGDTIDFKQAALNVRASADALPTELISLFSGNQELASILGDSVHLSMDIDTALSGQGNGAISLDVNSNRLACALDLDLGEVIRLGNKRPAVLSLTITPDSYAALRRYLNKDDQGQFTLTEPATAKLTLHSLKIPRTLSLFQGGIEGDFHLDRLRGKDVLTDHSVSFDSFQGHITSKNIAEAVHFSMHTQGSNAQSTPSAGKIEGTLNRGFTPDGSINHQDLSLSFNANINTLPVSLLCQFVCLDPKLKQKIEALIGPTLNANIQAQLQQMSGPFFADVQGSNGHFTLDAYLNNGILTLNQDITAQLKVTPELGEHVLKDLIPILGGMLSAEHPISLTLYKEGFYLPLRNASPLNIQIPHGTLNLGKVRFSEKSQIAKAFNLLIPNSSSPLVWLTPAYFSLNQGTVTLERVDMLISGNYPVAAWGNVDIGKDRVDMVIGLSGAAIAKAFHVTGISNNYFLQLPLKGRLNNASIDKTKVVGRLSALAAHSQGGPQGAVLGTVLDIATGGLTENPVPPPTTNPLPWQDLMAQTEESNDSKTNPEKTLNPIKELEQGASSLFKKIFR